MARNLISLIDGTMVSASRTDTYKSYSNVFELACLLQLTDKSKDGSPQIVFYTSGISSQPDNSNIFNLLTGNSIKSQIIDQYTNICANFDFDAVKDGKPQDKIYLFGFSRGAMAARALAGLIAEFGLLHPTHIRHLPRVLDAWDRTLGRGSLPDHIELMPVQIEFLGVFDSVMGGIERMRMFNPINFSNSRMPGRVRNAVQILAIDENRTFFKPKQWAKAERGIDAKGRPMSAPFLRQIWMPGVHSDVGGTGDPLWGRASLLAMTFYLNKRTDLRLNDKWIAQKEENLRNSFDGPFHIRPHRGLFTKFVRQPVREDRAKERGHPVCDALPAVNYDGRDGFDWRESIFRRHFEKIRADQELVDYFRRILKPARKVQQPESSPTAPTVARGREATEPPLTEAAI